MRARALLARPRAKRERSSLEGSNGMSSKRRRRASSHCFGRIGAVLKVGFCFAGVWLLARLVRKITSLPSTSAPLPRLRSSEGAACRFIQSQHYYVDDRGRRCAADLGFDFERGCCRNSMMGSRAECDAKSSCCSAYTACVSCCIVNRASPPSEGPLYKVMYPLGVNVRRAPNLGAPIATSLQHGEIVESVAERDVDGWILVKPQKSLEGSPKLWMKLFADGEPLLKRTPSKRGIFGGLIRHTNCYHADRFIACSCKCRSASSSLLHETSFATEKRYCFGNEG